MQGYAVIGWGSLIWDLDDLAPKVLGDWQMGAGPRLALEFSRVSAKRRGALTVVLDPVHGAPCPTHVIASRKSEIAAVAADLAARERAPEARIGAVCLRSGHSHGASEAVVASVLSWCESAGWAGAVWTDLPGNFADEAGRPFSIPAARDYLGALPTEPLTHAVRYIENAPKATETPLRRALSADPWWQALAARPGMRDG